MERKRSYEELKAEVEGLSIDERRATPAWKRMRHVCELTEAFRDSIKDKLRAKYPGATEEDIKKRFALVWLGAELTKKAYGWEVAGDDGDLMVW